MQPKSLEPPHELLSSQADDDKNQGINNIVTIYCNNDNFRRKIQESFLQDASYGPLRGP